jgi:hypothetical protein
MANDDSWMAVFKHWLWAVLTWIIGYSAYLSYLALYGPNEPVITAARIGTFVGGLVAYPLLYLIAIGSRKRNS